MNVEKRIHPVWLEWKRMQDEHPEFLIHLHRRESIIGKYQYIYTSKKGRISLVELPNYFLDHIDLWEICGSMTPDGDIERFGSKEEAEKRIKELLE